MFNIEEVVQNINELSAAMVQPSGEYEGRMIELSRQRHGWIKSLQETPEVRMRVGRPFPTRYTFLDERGFSLCLDGVKYLKRMYEGSVIDNMTLARLFKVLMVYFCDKSVNRGNIYPNIRVSDDHMMPYGITGVRGVSRFGITLTNTSRILYPSFQAIQSLYNLSQLIEVIRFGKDKSARFIQTVFHSRNARMAGYSDNFWVFKGQYYYPSVGSGAFLRCVNPLTANNKLHALIKLGFDLNKAICSASMGHFELPSPSQFDVSDNVDIAKTVSAFFNKFVDRCRLAGWTNDFGHLQNSTFLLGQSPCEDSNHLLMENYISVIRDVSKDNYNKIYNADWNQLAIDTTLYKLASSQYTQILLTHEPTDKDGITRFELIDLEPIPVLSSLKLARYKELDSANK